uniref:Uncharacterized protein n=1 Tax=Parascaris equorum TaxID=6256 RepID=A0A914R2R5_PAREQ
MSEATNFFLGISPGSSTLLGVPTTTELEDAEVDAWGNPLDAFIVVLVFTSSTGKVRFLCSALDTDLPAKRSKPLVTSHGWLRLQHCWSDLKVQREERGAENRYVSFFDNI